MKAIMLLALIAITTSLELNQPLNKLDVEVNEVIYSKSKKQSLKFVGVNYCDYFKLSNEISCCFDMKYRDLMESDSFEKIEPLLVHVSSLYFNFLAESKGSQLRRL
jgi:hypothetical protein